MILACRSGEKGEAAKKRIATRVPAASVEVALIETGDLASVRAFADSFAANHRRLDLLINNAGILMTPYFRTEDGVEGRLGVNYLGHFLLTRLLLPVLDAAPGSRVVSLYSLAHRWDGIRFDDIHFQHKYDAQKAYSQSKMACLMFGLELYRRIKKSGRDTVSLPIPGSPNRICRAT